MSTVFMRRQPKKIAMKFLNKLPLLLLPLLLSTNSWAQQVVIDEIVAKVSDYIILKSDVERAYLQLESEKQYLGDNPRCTILRQLAINKLMMAKAELDSVIVEDAAVEGEMNRRMQYFMSQFGSREKMEKTLGKTLTELREELREQVKEQLVVQRMQMEITGDVSVRPAEVRRFFNSIPKDSIPFLAAEVEVGQIVKYPEVSKSEKENTRQKLLEIKHKIENGADFATMAKQYSEDYGSASKGGDLGWHGRSELVPEFEAVALTIEPNEIADPVESEFGYHLIQLQERRGNRFRARHILIRPRSTPQDLKKAEQLLDSLRTDILADSLSFQIAVKEESDDQATRENAGFFKDNSTGSSFVSTDELDPVVFFTIDTMKVNDISKPLPFRTKDGKEAVRLLYYKSYKPPHYANFKDDYQKLYAMTAGNKRNEAIEKWIRKASKEVFIDIDEAYRNCNFLEEHQ